MNSQAEQENREPGKVMILPSSFQGSPRNMQQHYQDAMAIVSKYGRPDLFVTFTCNPKCQDIKDALPAGQSAADRPDIVARVFKLHLDELLKDIREKKVLGEPVAFIYVIEFQKRGLPHCHLLIILSDGSKIRLATDIDTLICAEIPDPVAQPELHEIVKATMIHGPCGALNKNSPCMAEDKCSKDFPKQFCEKTALAIDGYPHYRRSDNGRTVKVGIHEVDNRFIVPYNPYLTKKFKAHINVEACTSIKSVKYLFKYVYKGHDCASIEVTEENHDHNEVKMYLDARYVSAPEAYWRLSSFKMYNHSHSIIRLALHLPDHQPVVFQAGNHAEAAEAASRKDTSLTAFFKRNASHPTEYTYKEFPKHFVFAKGTGKWAPRKKGSETTIGRVYSASPKDSERFCLRLLLHHIPGPTSYENIRTVDGHTVATFKEACILRHLLEDDTEWDRALEEASVFQMPSQLRSLFATICVHCETTNPLELWEAHKGAMVEDFMHNNMSAQAAEQKALQVIEDILQQHRMSCNGLGLPAIDPAQQFDPEPEFDIAVEEENAAALIAKLNDKQRMLVDRVLQDIAGIQEGQPPRCRAYFLDGPGGSGKTMCYNALISFCRSRGVNVSSAAWTGIAATLLAGGRTCHSLFKLPVPILDTTVCNVSPTSPHADVLRSSILFIIDEASMVPANALSAIDKMLRDITGIINVPFGGKIFLLGGDFRQVLPVVPRQPRTVIVENCLKCMKEPDWSIFQVFKLTKNMRAGADQQEFARWLLALGNGELMCENPEMPPSTIEIPPQVNVVNDNIIDEVFSEVSDAKAIANTVILTPTNERSLHLNNKVIKKLQGPSKTYVSADKAICDDETEANNYPIEFLNSLTPTGMPPHCLTLKPGAIVMLLRNINIKQGLCNGTRLTIRRLHEHIVDAEILTGAFKDQRVLIPRVKLAPSDVNLPFVLQRIQFPLRLSYCMTINKSQGQTFDKLGIYLQSPVFSHGQLYVALSRARSFKDVSVEISQTAVQGRFGTKIFTQNIVYKEVL
jgi:hypothetical protein